MTIATAKRLAGLLALASAAMAVFLAVRGSARPIVVNQSLATLSAVVASAMGATLFGRVYLLNQTQWQRLLERWRTLTPPAGFRAISFIVIIFAFGLHSELAGARRPYKNVEYIDDERDYLRVAKEIQSLPGSVFGLLPALYRGEFAEDNRHPVYPALLAAGQQVRIVDRALIQIPEILSTAFGLFVVLTTAIVAWKMFGPAVAALSAFLVAVNGAMTQASSLIACETLLVLLTTLGWYVFSRDGQRSAPLRVAAKHVLIGALFGLAYFTKASAAFPLFILIALILFQRPCRLSKLRWLSAAIIVLAFAAVASPLLVRNTVRYRNPLHSFNNKLLFAESFESGIAEPDLGTLGNLKRFARRHTVKEIVVDRFFGGLVWEGFVLLRTLGPAPFDSGRAIFGAVFLIAAVIGIGSEVGRRLSPAFLILWTAWFMLFFGWYQPIASGDRFLLPLVPPLAIASSLGILCVLQRAAKDL